MGAQNLNHALKFTQNGEFLDPNLVLLEENVPTRKFLTGQNLGVCASQTGYVSHFIGSNRKFKMEYG